MALGPDHTVFLLGSFFWGIGGGLLSGLEGLLPGDLTWNGAGALGLGWDSEPVPGRLRGSSRSVPSLDGDRLTATSTR